jgi:hypothetical protein
LSFYKNKKRRDIISAFSILFFKKVFTNKISLEV